MASKKTTRALEAKLSRLKSAFGELVKQSEEMEKKFRGGQSK